MNIFRIPWAALTEKNKNKCSQFLTIWNTREFKTGFNVGSLCFVDVDLLS